MKKGQMSWQMIAYAGLALLIFFVLAFIFSENIRDSVKGILSLGEDAEDAARGEKCESFFTGRVCRDTCPENYDSIGTVGDCNNCCEKIG